MNVWDHKIEFFTAATEGNLRVVDKLLNKFTNQEDRINFICANGNLTVFSCVVQRNQFDMAKRLAEELIGNSELFERSFLVSKKFCKNKKMLYLYEDISLFKELINLRIRLLQSINHATIKEFIEEYLPRIKSINDEIYYY